MSRRRRVLSLALACAFALAPAAAHADAPPSSPVPISPVNKTVLDDPQSIIEYMADPATDVVFELDGVELAPLVPFPDGFVDYFPLAPLAPGLHTVRAKAVDGAGNESRWSPTTGFAIRSAAPATVPGDPAGDDPADDDPAPDDGPVAVSAPAATPPPVPAATAATPAVHTTRAPAVAVSRVRLRGSVLQACAKRAHHCLERMAVLSLSVSRAATVGLTLRRKGAATPGATQAIEATRAGTIQVVLRRRFAGHALAAGSYTLAIQATARTGGATSPTVTRAISVR